MIDSHANGSEETRDTSCRKMRRRSHTTPRDRSEMRDLVGDGQTNWYEEDNRRVDVLGQDPFGIVE